MDFLNSLNEIRKNNHKFGIWEKEQNDKQAQRDALNESREYTPEEIEKAKALGENIINAIDVMDNHSESVAENIETATTPIIGLAPYIGGGAALIGSVKFLISPAYIQIAQKRRETLDTEAAKNLVEEIRDHYKNTNNYYMQNFNSRKLLSEWDTNRIDNALLKNKVKNFQKEYAKSIAKYNRKINVGFWGSVVAAIVSFVAANIYATSLQVEGSKIARFQARKFLEDPKAFVNYTPEQIAQAKAEIEANPMLRKQKKKEKLKQGFFSSIKGLFRDRAEYRQARAFDTDESKKVHRQLSVEELKQAEKDKEVIQRTVKIINNQAEKYSENMEVAAGVLIGGTPFLGAGIAGLLKLVLEKTGILDKWVANKVAETDSDEIKKLYDEYTTLATKKNKNVKEQMEQVVKFSGFASSFKERFRKIENVDSIKNTEPTLINRWKDNFVISMANKTSRGWVIAGIGAAITSVAGLILGLKLQKSAARAGRYTAKRELEEDPKNFIGYTQEDYKEVENVKATKKEQSKVKEVVMFLPNVLKQYFAYDKYRKHEFKEEQLLNEQLRKQDVSEEQLRDAKNLQRKIFNTFEKVDDNSQVYSESMEAAIEIAQPFVLYGGFAAALAPIMYYGSLIAKGKKSPAEAIQKVSKILEKSSNIMKTKMFKKYLNSIEKNIPNAVQRNLVSERPLAQVLAGVSLADDSVISVLQKSMQNIKTSIKDLDKVPDDVIRNHIDNIQSLLNKSNGMVDKETLAIMNKAIDEFKYIPKQEKADILNMFFNPESIKDLPKERYQNAVYDLKDILKKSLPEEKKQVLEKTLQDFDKSKRPFDEILIDLSNQKNFVKLTEIMNEIKKLELVSYLPEEMQKAKIKDVAKSFIEKYSNDPKQSLKELREKISKMTDEEFANKYQGSMFSGFDKKSATESLASLEKIYDNIPKEEVKKIFDAAFVEFNKNPDEFVKLLKNGNIGSVLQTPELKKALKIAGISWITFNIVITYVLESWLAELQLKAGRLGVMKSLEDLEDPRYYANIEPTT